MNWRNTAENLLLVLVGVVFGSILGFKIAASSSDRVIEQLIPTIDRAIDKETIKNEIKNDIDLKIDKLKKSDSIQINVNQEPNNKQEIEAHPVPVSSAVCKDGNVCVPIKTLTRKQKKSLGWL